MKSGKSNKHPKSRFKGGGGKSSFSGPVKAKKHLGQHFLKDENIARKIAESLSMEGYSSVLEIGPGTGVMTKYLLREDVDLAAMELDEESVVYLRHSFPLEHPIALKKAKSFKVIQGDFLRYDLALLFDKDPFCIICNFPTIFLPKLYSNCWRYGLVFRNFAACSKRKWHNAFVLLKAVKPMESFRYWFRHFTNRNTFSAFLRRFLTLPPRCSRACCA